MVTEPVLLFVISILPPLVEISESTPCIIPALDVNEILPSDDRFLFIDNPSDKELLVIETLPSVFVISPRDTFPDSLVMVKSPTFFIDFEIS